MCNKTKKILYWISLIGPIVDVLKGTVVGLINAYKTVKAERQALEAETKLQQQIEQFRNDNM